MRNHFLNSTPEYSAIECDYSSMFKTWLHNYVDQVWSRQVHSCHLHRDVYKQIDKQTDKPLTHWVTHICVSKLTIIDSGNDLSPGRRQAIIWTNAGILLIRTLGTNFCEILSEIHEFWFKKMHLKMSSAKWRPFCLGLKVLNENICQNLQFWQNVNEHILIWNKSSILCK